MRSDKMQILMLLENLPFPQDLRVRREALALASAGHRVTVICPKAKGQPFHESVNEIGVYRYPAPPQAKGFAGYLLEYGYSMAAALLLSMMVFAREGFDVVHAHNPPDTFVFLALIYKLFGKRFVYDHHDLSPEMYRARFRNGGNGIVYTVLLWLERLSCRFADHVIVTNESYKRFAMERGRVPERRITVVRNGIELSILRRQSEPCGSLRQMQKCIIGYVGVMGYQDGVDCLLRVLHHLIHDQSRSDFYCVVIGAGDAWADMRRLARDLGLQNHVHLPGFVFGEDLRRYLSATDICIDAAPSNAYTDHSTMFKIMEYMSLAKPVVTFDLPEHRYTAGQAAVYVPPNDERAFAKALAELMDDPHRRALLGTIGLRRVRDLLAWDYSVPHLLRVYQDLQLAQPQGARAEATERSEETAFNKVLESRLGD